MTDEERQKLCESLRLAFSPWPCRIAADEIERLAERLKAAHGYADECEARIKMLCDQIDQNAMTDEERQKLVKWLRDMQHTYGQSGQYGAIADEIEYSCKVLRLYASR